MLGPANSSRHEFQFVEEALNPIWKLLVTHLIFLQLLSKHTLPALLYLTEFTLELD